MACTIAFQTDTFGPLILWCQTQLPVSGGFFSASMCAKEKKIKMQKQAIKKNMRFM